MLEHLTHCSVGGDILAVAYDKADGRLNFQQ